MRTTYLTLGVPPISGFLPESEFLELEGRREGELELAGLGMLGLFSLKSATCAAPPPNKVPDSSAGSCPHSTEKEERCSSSAGQPVDFTSTLLDQAAQQPGRAKSTGRSSVPSGARARGTGRPAWAFQAGAPQCMPVLASREPAAGHGNGVCVCCTKPQVHQAPVNFCACRHAHMPTRITTIRMTQFEL